MAAIMEPIRCGEKVKHFETKRRRKDGAACRECLHFNQNKVVRPQNDTISSARLHGIL
jgi:hypothetical protein